MKQGPAESRVVKQLRHGQITIPKHFREALGIDPDDLLQVTLAEGKLEVAPVKAAAKHPAWARRLYDLFAPVRDSLEPYSESDIDATIDEAVRQVRTGIRGGM